MNLLVAINETYNQGKRFFVRNQPRIFMTGGLILSGMGTVTACTATYKNIDKIIDRTKDRMDHAVPAPPPDDIGR